MHSIAIRIVIALLLLAPLSPHSSTTVQAQPSVLSFVNPFVGTGGHGHTFPGATAPFGMVQLSPDTRLEGWDGCSGYHYTDEVVYGFSHTHLSGTGVADYNDVLLMPTMGAIQLDNGAQNGPASGYASAFDKAQEKASPGYYSTQLLDHPIRVELTASERVGFHRYTFAGARQGNVILDLLHRDMLLGDTLIFNKLSEAEISGYRYSKAWANRQMLHFVIRFSKRPRVEAREWKDGRLVKVGMQFDLDSQGELLVKVGISAVSINNARENLMREVPHWDFDATRAQTEARWAAELGRIEVEGGTADERTNFYTALYHCMIAPNVWSDVNGQYRGMDGQVHQAAPGRQVYTVFSLWDTFRANNPLFTLIQQNRTNDFIRTFLHHYQQGGRLPVWELAANETECMIGYHSVSVVADAYAKGLRDWDQGLMLQAMTHGAMLDHFGLNSYKAHGCVLAADEAESVSKTLEYAYDDWCIAHFAKALGQDSIYRHFMERAQYYKNLFDPETGFFRARVDGNWFGPFDPTEVNFNYTEANAWQYAFFVPHDLQGLMRMLGGADAFERRLDGLFEAPSQIAGRQQADITGLIGQYAHGNEPSHHVAYLYNFIGKPWKTQARVHQIRREMYQPQPDGLSGNEDCGQMSAWYVFSALGMYPVSPGTPLYSFGTPLFNRVTIHLENGQKVVFEAPRRQAEDVYIQQVKHNGQPHPYTYVSHADLMAGGVWQFEMGSQPNTQWGTDISLSAITSISEEAITPTPAIVFAAHTFIDSMEVSIEAACSNCRYQYRLNGQERAYTGPFVIHDTGEITAWAIAPDGRRSRDIQQSFYKIKGGRSAHISSQYANQYSAGGPMALIDYQRGSHNFRTGRWQGYEGQAFSAVVDMGELVQPAQVGAGFLQDLGSWIFYPRSVSFSYSIDGQTFMPLGTVGHSWSDRDYTPVTHDFAVPNSHAFRYLKVEAVNYGPCPAWHAGAGGPTWLFIDEIWMK